MTRLRIGLLPLTGTIAGFLGRVKQALGPLNVKVSADTFGYTAWMTNDMGIGQV